MKNCPNCNSSIDDNAAFCTACGTRFEVENTQQQTYQAPPPNYAPAYNSYDHTAEFDAKDISDNKVIAMLVYLLGTVGIIIALLAGNNSPYASFHARQALKFTVTEILASICALILCWTIIVPLAYFILILTLTVIKYICFFQICSGKAKEPAIIRSLKFLK